MGRGAAAPPRTVDTWPAAVRSRTMEVRFVIVAPQHARKSVRVRLPCDVGRGEEVKFRIRQVSVSRRHCSFALDGAAVTLTDLDSTNGTFLAGTKIPPQIPTPVPSGAEVRIGGTVVRVDYAPAAVAAVPPEADTVPLAATDLPELEPVGDRPEPELQPRAETVPELEVAEPVPVAAAAAGPEFPEVVATPAADAATLPDVERAPPPAAGSFDFLGGEAAAPPESDDKLDDFFKSLS